MLFGDFLNTMASKIGVQNEQSVIDLLSRSELASVEIDDELASRFNTGLMSLDGAKNNTALLAHFKPIVLKAIDEQFASTAEKYGFSDENANEKNTYKRLELMDSKIAAKIAELEAKAGRGGSAGAEVEKLTKQIADLQSQLASQKTAHEKELSDLKGAHESENLSMLINLALRGKNYANKELGDTNVTVARALLDQALKDSKAIVINDSGSVKLKQAENPTLDYVDSGFKTVGFDEFVDQLLANKHLLEVNNGGGSFVPPTQKPPTVTTQQQERDTSRVAAAAAASLADLS